MRPIDADALELEAYSIWVHGSPETKYRMNALKDLIDKAPTIAGQHWIDDIDNWICPVCRLEVTNPNNYEGCKCPRCGFQDPKDAAKHYWINRGDYVTTAYGSLDVKECSNCHADITIDHYDNYCPNCGVEMNGEKRL